MIRDVFQTLAVFVVRCAHSLSLAAAIVVLLAVHPAWGQIDTPAARDARANIYQLRQTLGSQAAASAWWRQLNLDDVEAELRLADRTKPDVLAATANGLKKDGAGQFRELAFQRLAEALAARAEELRPIPQAQWPDDCRREAKIHRLTTPEMLAAARQAMAGRLDALERLLPSLAQRDNPWAVFVCFDETRALATSASLPDAATLDRLEARWCNAVTVWNAAELVEASLAVRSCIVLLRAHAADESPEQHAAAWEELARLVAARSVSDDGAASKIAAAIHQRERLGESCPVTTSIRRELSRPNIVLAVRREYIEQSLGGKIDEPFDVNGVYAGASTRGSGTLSGFTRGDVAPSSTVGRWNVSIEATAHARASGYGDGVRVQSRATTNIRGVKTFLLDASGLVPQNAAMSAATSITYDSIESGGWIFRRNEAERRTYARRGQAEAESAAATERSIAARLDADGNQLAADFNASYRGQIRDRLIRKNRPGPEVRFRAPQRATSIGVEDAVSWECRLEGNDDFAAPGSPPEMATGGDVVVSIAESALTQLASADLAGGTFTGGELSAALEGMLGGGVKADALTTEQGGANRDENTDDSDQDEPEFSVTFAEEPCKIRLADGQLHATYHLVSLTSDDTEYPAMRFDVQYSIEPRSTGLVLVRQGSLRVGPATNGDRRSANGPEQSLRIVVQRMLGKTLAQELNWPLPALDRTGPVPQLHIERLRAERGWLQFSLAPAKP